MCRYITTHTPKYCSEKSRNTIAKKNQTNFSKKVLERDRTVKSELIPNNENRNFVKLIMVGQNLPILRRIPKKIKGA